MYNIEYSDGKCVMDNGILRTVIRPEPGGKITSLYSLKKNEELLFQPPKNDYEMPHMGSGFEKYEASGFDDAFPNIDAEEFLLEGRKISYNDHGDIWSSPMDMYLKEGCIVVHTRTKDYSFVKSVRLENNRLIASYMIRNVSEADFPCFYTMHCLFKCTENMRIIFPDEVIKAENAIESERLGKAGSIHSFPVTESGVDLSRVRSRKSGKYEKIYALGKVREGSCGIYYPDNDIKVRIDWDTKILPYLGFWVTEGGFRGDYNCALEPSSGYYDSVSKAYKNKSLWILKPGEEKSFEISISVDV